MKETKITCPVCGAEFAIPEHSHVATGTVIGKDSNLGEIHPQLANPGTGAGTAFMASGAGSAQAPTCPANKAAERISALQAAGVDVSNLFAMQGASGNGMVARMTNGVLSVVDDDDPIFNVIKQGGMIPDRRLFRRWVMGQMFRMLTEKDYRTGKPIGFTEALHSKGYEYQFKMLADELDVQAKLSVRDAENFQERTVWFNKDVAVALANDYFTKLSIFVEDLKERKCHGRPYKTVPTRGDIFVDELQAKLFTPTLLAIGKLKKAKDVVDLAKKFRSFNALRVKLPYHTTQCAEWVRAYKGAGAFFTLKNLILFHGCFIYGSNGAHMDKDASLGFINVKAVEYATEGWRMLALMNKVLEDNHIDIEAKMAEWRKR